MVRNMKIARDLRYLNIPKGLVVVFRKIQSMPDHKITLICTGSQGEPMAALARMANGDHQIKVGEGDTVLMASSLIPGNENAIYGIINKLTDLGANIVHKCNAKVHVSGHASAGELVYCYNIVRPKNVMPVHGESKHLHPGAAGQLGVGVQVLGLAAPGCRRRTSSSHRTVPPWTWSTARRRSPAMSRPAWSTSTVRPSAPPPRTHSPSVASSAAAVWSRWWP